jgi:hypothetical protein
MLMGIDFRRRKEDIQEFLADIPFHAFSLLIAGKLIYPIITLWGRFPETYLETRKDVGKIGGWLFAGEVFTEIKGGFSKKTPEVNILRQ